MTKMAPSSKLSRAVRMGIVFGLICAVTSRNVHAQAPSARQKAHRRDSSTTGTTPYLDTSMPTGEALKTIESTLSTQFQDSFSSHFRLSMRALVHLDGAGRPDYAYPFRNMPYLEVRRSPHRGPFGAYYPEGYRDRYGSEGLHFFDSRADAERAKDKISIWKDKLSSSENSQAPPPQADSK